MEERELTGPGVRLRPFRWDDIPDLVALFNRTWVDEPVTVEQMEHWERTYPAENPRRRYMVEARAGQLVGTGSCMNPFWLEPSGRYDIDIVIDPAWQRRGIGRAVLAELIPFAMEQGAERLWSNCREDFVHSAAFLKDAGFTNIGVRFESRVDLDAFDVGRVPAAVRRITAAGYTVTTHAEQRKLDPDADHKLFELYRGAAGDVPLPGGARMSPAYETWRNWLLEGPTVDPAAIFVALLGDEWAGMTALELPETGPAITQATAVARPHRGRGVAMALKLASLQYLKERGYKEARTHNDTANPPILHLNEKIGYQRLPGWLEWQRPLPAAPKPEEG